MEIYIRRNNEEFGPFSREVALEYVRQGVFKTGDRACYAGVHEWKTVGELLGISISSRPGHAAEFTQTDKITEFNPTWTPAPDRLLRPHRRDGLKRPFLIVLNSVLILIAITVATIRLVGGRQLSEQCVAALSGQLSRLANALSAAEPTPAPAIPAPVVQKAPTAAPAPAPVAATPPSTPPAPAAPPAVMTEAPAPAEAPSATPELAAAPTPTPAPSPPKSFDPADLQANPGAWPKTLTLQQPVVFPALFNGQIVGSVTAPPGTLVNLVKIQGGQLILEFNRGTQTVPWKWTDLEQRAAQAGSTAPPPPTLPGPAAP